MAFISFSSYYQLTPIFQFCIFQSLLICEYRLLSVIYMTFAYKSYMWLMHVTRARSHCPQLLHNKLNMRNWVNWVLHHSSAKKITFLKCQRSAILANDVLCNFFIYAKYPFQLSSNSCLTTSFTVLEMALKIWKFYYLIIITSLLEKKTYIYVYL